MVARNSRSAGPGWLVAAAFIGPGTVFTASRAGAGWGASLLWTILFSILATVVLQQMASRLGIVTRGGLGQALRGATSGASRVAVMALIAGAVVVGNAAFQAGNLLGASSGGHMLLAINPNWLVLALALAAGAILWTGYLKLVQWLLAGLVALMSIAFIATAVISRPDIGTILSGFVPSFSVENLPLVVALIGTTVVPYNLFLHAQAASIQWRERETNDALAENRWDSITAICIGGLITASIMVTAAAAFFGDEATPQIAAEVARQLEPTLGSVAGVLFAIGLLSAGFTSAVTAPLAAGLAAAGCFGWSTDPRSAAVRSVMFAVLSVGAVAAILFGGSPMQTIIAAQVLNGLLLPIIAVFLLVAMNSRRLLGEYRNRWPGNILGSLVVVVIAGLAVFQVVNAISRLW